MFCLQQDEFLIYCLQAFSMNGQNLYLSNVQLYEHLYARILSLNRQHTNKVEWTAGISLTYSKNRREPKIDPWGTLKEILDKSEKWLFMLTLNTRYDKYNIFSWQRNQKLVIYLEKFHALLYLEPFEDQLVWFPWKVFYQNLSVF